MYKYVSLLSEEGVSLIPATHAWYSSQPVALRTDSVLNLVMTGAISEAERDKGVVSPYFFCDPRASVLVLGKRLI